MIATVVLQLVTPIVLLTWLFARPLPSAFGLATQVMATGSVCWGLLTAGVWLFPPWWMPLAYLAAFLAGGLHALSRRPPTCSWLPRSPAEWAVVGGLAIVAVLSGIVAAEALAGRRPIPDAVELAFPLRGGPFLIANGGSTAAVNAHFATLAPDDPMLRAYRGQSYGVDIVKLNAWGGTAAGAQPPSPKEHVIFGETVMAPCAGQVVSAVDGWPDMTVPRRDRRNPAGNHVLLRCGTIEVLLGHFAMGSVRVRGGQTVKLGEPLAQVGNSGNTTAPHLHIHAQMPSTNNHRLSGDPLPIRLNGRWLVRNDRFFAP